MALRREARLALHGDQPVRIYLEGFGLRDRSFLNWLFVGADNFDITDGPSKGPMQQL